MRWTFCIKSDSTPSALFHPTATSRALPHAYANRRCSCWVWESRKRHAPSLVLVTSLSTLTFCTRRAPTPQRAKRRKTAKRNRATRLHLSPQRVQPRQRPRKSRNPPKPKITTTKKRPRSTSLKLIRKSQSSKNAIPVVSTTSPTRIPTDLISSP